MSLFKTTTSIAPALIVTTVTNSTTGSVVDYDSTSLRASGRGFVGRIFGGIRRFFAGITCKVKEVLSLEYKRVKPDGTMGKPIKIHGERLTTTTTSCSVTSALYGLEEQASEERINTYKNASLNRSVAITSTQELKDTLNILEQEETAKVDPLKNIPDQELERLLEINGLLPVDTNVKTNIK